MLQESLNKFVKWCTNNNLNLNPSECKTVTFSRARTLIEGDYTINIIIIIIIIEKSVNYTGSWYCFDTKMSLRSSSYYS